MGQVQLRDFLTYSASNSATDTGNNIMVDVGSFLNAVANGTVTSSDLQTMRSELDQAQSDNAVKLKKSPRALLPDNLPDPTSLPGRWLCGLKAPLFEILEIIGLGINAGHGK